MILPLLIAAWITITPLPQQSPDNSVMLVEFRIDALDAEIMDLNNYELVDQNNNAVDLLAIDSISELDGITIDKTKIVAITTERLKSKTAYTLSFINHSSWFYYDGFVPNKISTPAVEVRQ